jgi:uncharacterized DUF497 family protein
MPMKCSPIDELQLFITEARRLTTKSLRSGNIRIISARLATRQEREDYEQNAL